METAVHQNVNIAEDHTIPSYATKKEENKRCSTLMNRIRTGKEKRKTKTKMATKSKKECTICDKVFLKNNELEEHLKTHKDIETFPCDLCGKQFFLKWRLKKHIVGHDGKRFCHFL